MKRYYFFVVDRNTCMKYTRARTLRDCFEFIKKVFHEDPNWEFDNAGALELVGSESEFYKWMGKINCSGRQRTAYKEGLLEGTFFGGDCIVIQGKDLNYYLILFQDLYYSYAWEPGEVLVVPIMRLKGEMVHLKAEHEEPEELVYDINPEFACVSIFGQTAEGTAFELARIEDLDMTLEEFEKFVEDQDKRLKKSLKLRKHVR